MDSKEILHKCEELQVSKGSDYTSDIKANQFENFDRSAYIASWFNCEIDKPFAILIGTKLARLASLLNRDSKPNYEPIEDTLIDLTNYCALWCGRRNRNY
jgi:hypothetical protein